MGRLDYNKPDFGLFDWIDSLIDIETLYKYSAILCGIGTLILGLVLKPSWWYMWIFVAAVSAWMLPVGILYSFVIIPIYLIAYPIWGLLHLKNKSVLRIIGIALFIFVGGFVSIKSVQFCATKFATPNAHTWEYAYVSESPYAKKYHHDSKCKFLQQSTYDYELMEIDEAEEQDLEPCNYCLKNNLKHQYDNYIGWVCILVYLLMYYLIHKFYKKYRFQNPIVKRKDQLKDEK